MRAPKWLAILGFLAVVLGPGARAATVLQWTATPPSDSGAPLELASGPNTKHRSAVDAGGNLILVGSDCGNPPGSPSCGVTRPFAAKYEADTGRELWRVTSAFGQLGSLAAVAVDASGDAYVVGTVLDANNANTYQYAAKLAGADGTIIEQVVGAPGQPAITHNSGIDVALDAAGNPYVLGERDQETIVTRYNPADGSVIWSSAPAFDSALEQIPLALGIDPNGDVLGFTYVANGDSSVLFKLTGNAGERIWGTPLTYGLHVPGGPDIEAFTLDGAGKPILAGHDVAKFSNVDGSNIWTVPFNPCCTSNAFDVATLSNGDVVAVGAAGLAANFTRYASATGAVLVSNNLAGGSATVGARALSVAINHTDRVFVAAEQKVDGAAQPDYVTLNLDPATLAPPVNGLFAHFTDSGTPVAQTLLITSDGVIVVGITNPGTTTDPQFVRLLKYIRTPPPAATKLDFNGDGNADLVFQHADGNVEVRLMQGTLVIGSATFVPSAPGRIVGTTGDFNGDGKADLLFARNDGAVEMWLMDGTSLTSITTIMPAGTGWQVMHVGDFNADGKSDILWRNVNGAVGLWLMNGSSISSRAPLFPAGTPWVPELAADFNGDGMTDIVWRKNDGSVSMWLMDGSAILDRGPLLGVGNTLSPIRIGDFNADNKADLVFQDVSTGAVQLWLMNGRIRSSTATVMGPNTRWTVTQTGDFNGDGMSDLIWTANDGTVGMWLMNGATTLEHKTEMAAGLGWSVSVAEDLNDNGMSDLVWSNTNGAVGAWLMNGTSIASRSPLEPSGSTNKTVAVQFHR